MRVWVEVCRVMIVYKICKSAGYIRDGNIMEVVK